MASRSTAPQLTATPSSSSLASPHPPRQSSFDSKSITGSFTDSYVDVPPPSPGVPKLPETLIDTSLSFESIIAEAKFSDTDIDPKKKEVIEKRASNVLRLAQESEKLNAELKALSERLRAAEERQAELRRRAQEQASQQASQQASAGDSTGATHQF